jgi:hypothetical protein
MDFSRMGMAGIYSRLRGQEFFQRRQSGAHGSQFLLLQISDRAFDNALCAFRDNPALFLLALALPATPLQ